MIDASDKTPPLVLIEWQDACGVSSNWQDLKEITAKPLFIKSAGWLVFQDKKCCIIAGNFSSEHESAAAQICGTMIIPIVSIRKITELAAVGFDGQ